jgi:hypothetical protein
LFTQEWEGAFQQGKIYLDQLLRNVVFLRCHVFVPFIVCRKFHGLPEAVEASIVPTGVSGNDESRDGRSNPLTETTRGNGLLFSIKARLPTIREELRTPLPLGEVRFPPKRIVSARRLRCPT